jgi:hypothetical protein
VRIPTSIQAALIAAAAVVVQLPLYDRGLVSLDEGQLFAIANRINGGETLYQDIYTGIFPGIYYLTALLLDVAGNDLVVTRWAALFVNTAIAILLWRLASRIVRPGWALVPPVALCILIFLSFPVLTMLSYSMLALLFALLAILALIRYAESGRAIDGVVVGVALAACALTKQNFGAFTLFGILIGHFSLPRHGPAAGDVRIRSLLPIAAAGAVVTGLAFGGLAAAGTWHHFMDATVLGLFGTQLTAFNQPLPPIFGHHPPQDGRFMFFYTPPLLFNYAMHGEPFLGFPVTETLRSWSVRLGYGLTLGAMACAPLVLFAARHRPLAQRCAGRVICAFALLFFLGIFPSAIWSHLVIVMIPVLLLIALIADAIDRALDRLEPAATLAWRIGFLSILALAAAAVPRVAGEVRRWYSEPLQLPHAQLHVIPSQAILYRGAAEFLRNCAASEGPVFIAPDMPLLYTVTNRRNPTPYDLVIPGDVKDHAMVERLQSTRTRCIVYNPKMYAHFTDFRSCFPELAAYLEAAYERTTVIEAGGEQWYGLELVSQSGAGASRSQ